MPSYYGSHANKTTKGLRSGSILFGKDPTCQPTTNVSEFIAKQVLCRPDSYSKQEPHVRTLWPDVKTMVSHTKLTVPSAAPKQLSRCGTLWRLLADQLKMLFPDGDDEGAFVVPALDTRSQVLSIKDRRNGFGKPVFKLASFGCG